MNEKKSTIDPLLNVVSLLKSIGFLLVVGFVFVWCCENTYDRIYGDNHHKNKIENLLKNGKTILANLDQNYVISRVNKGNYYQTSYEFKYSFRVNDKVYNGDFTTEEFIPTDANRLKKYLTVHYLPEDPEVNQIDAETEYEYAKQDIEEHGIGMLLLNIFGLFVTFFMVLYGIFSVKEKAQNLDKPIENTYRKTQYQNEVNQKTDYSNFR
ncbi:hypothetical protein ACFFLS_10535 [Flavobacterium procerum]|uniref:DUF3592 domain-containing protein n=1 Tax=Flavobacterium procerum TaxID=1455569 RepID=A0ABV6BPU7_9FLAO